MLENLIPLKYQKMTYKMPYKLKENDIQIKEINFDEVRK